MTGYSMDARVMCSQDRGVCFDPDFFMGTYLHNYCNKCHLFSIRNNEERSPRWQMIRQA